MIQLKIPAILVLLLVLISSARSAFPSSITGSDTAQCKHLPPGSLVIAGGGLESNNSSVFSRLIELAGGSGNASFAVIPTAGGSPVQSYAYFRSTLISYGVKPGNIHLINIALADDDSTADVDESTWKNNGNDERLAETVGKCSCVWFTGGDQLRTTKALYRPDGSRTPVLEAVWHVFLKGGVIGGTSAGAAIMSDPMIGAGNSMGALKSGVVTVVPEGEFEDSNGVLLTRGLGFFPLGMVDQHFEARARIGRFIMAMLHEKDNLSLGFGVDENTALIYCGKDKKLEVAGASGVTIVNTSETQITYYKKLPCISNVIVSYLENGDSYDIANGMIIPAEGKKNVSGHENSNIANPLQTGMLSGSASDFKNLITVNLMDNKAVSKIENINFTDKETAFLITLSKTLNSQGFYTDKPDGNDHYTIKDVRMDIVPVKIQYKSLR